MNLVFVGSALVRSIEKATTVYFLEIYRALLRQDKLRTLARE
jgi:hypothetical protein